MVGHKFLFLYPGASSYFAGALLFFCLCEKVVVMLVYNDGSEIRAMTGDYTITAPEGFDNKKAGEYTFNVKYAKDASITAQFKVVVKAASDETTGGEPEAPEGVNPLAWIIPVVAAVVIGGAIAAVIIVKKKKNK